MNNIIAWWSGAIVDIPTGWSICDGNGGRPNLRNMFLICAGDTYNPDAFGGSANHDHAFTSDSHFHQLPADAALQYIGLVGHKATDSKNLIGTTDTQDSRPPYHALALIMKD